MRVTVRVWNRHVYESYGFAEHHSRMRFDFERIGEPPQAAEIRRNSQPPDSIIEGILCDRCMQETVTWSHFMYLCDPGYTLVRCTSCNARGAMSNPDDWIKSYA